MTETQKNPALYIVMRNDLHSLNPGKAMAQASHATNAFVHRVQKLAKASPVRKLYEKWARETANGFGTAIVLSGTPDQFDAAINDVEQDGGKSINPYDPFLFGTLHDPSYPVRDGAVTHLIPLDTCVWAFCDRNGDFVKVLKNFPLYR